MTTELLTPPCRTRDCNTLGKIVATTRHGVPLRENVNAADLERHIVQACLVLCERDANAPDEEKRVIAPGECAMKAVFNELERQNLENNPFFAEGVQNA